MLLIPYFKVVLFIILIMNKNKDRSHFQYQICNNDQQLFHKINCVFVHNGIWYIITEQLKMINTIYAKHNTESIVYSRMIANTVRLKIRALKLLICIILQYKAVFMNYLQNITFVGPFRHNSNPCSDQNQ